MIAQMCFFSDFLKFAFHFGLNFLKFIYFKEIHCGQGPAWYSNVDCTHSNLYGIPQNPYSPHYLHRTRGRRNLFMPVGVTSGYTGILRNFLKLMIFKKMFRGKNPRVADTSPFFLEQFVVFPDRFQEAEANSLLLLTLQSI